jgi:hypothetical protein
MSADKQGLTSAQSDEEPIADEMASSSPITDHDNNLTKQKVRNRPDKDYERI